MNPFKLFFLAFLLTAATQPPNHTLITPGKVALEWTFSDTHGTWDKDVKPETRIWLEVRSFNPRDWDKEGYNPSYCAIIVKDYKPIVRQLPDGRWEITFASPLAEGLP